MILDANLLFSDAQAVTAAAASTSYLDTSVVRDIGTGHDLYLVVQVQTTLTDGGANTGTDVYLYGDSTTTFTPDGSNLMFSFDQAAAAGTVKIAKLDPKMDALQYRYVEVYYDPQGANLTGGKFDAFITNDVSAYTAYADGITITD